MGDASSPSGPPLDPVVFQTWIRQRARHMFGPGALAQDAAERAYDRWTEAALLADPDLQLTPRQRRVLERLCSDPPEAESWTWEALARALGGAPGTCGNSPTGSPDGPGKPGRPAGKSEGAARPWKIPPP